MTLRGGQFRRPRFLARRFRRSHGVTAALPRQQAEPEMKASFRTGSRVGAYSWPMINLLHRRGTAMAEFLRSGAILLMGLTVIGAGIFVVMYA